jgi:hypothetical protein
MILFLEYTHPLRGAADAAVEITYDPSRGRGIARYAIATFARVLDFSLNSINPSSTRLSATRILADRNAPI